MVFTAFYPNRKADGHFNSWCPQSIAFGAAGVIKDNKDRLRSFPYLKRPKLAFCRPVPYCAAAEVLGEGKGLAVWAQCHRPPYLCSALNPNCSLGFSPLGVCRLWNLICSGWGNVRGTLNGRRRQIEGKCKYIQIKTWIILDKPVFVSFGFFTFIVGNCSDT